MITKVNNDVYPDAESKWSVKPLGSERRGVEHALAHHRQRPRRSLDTLVRCHLKLVFEQLHSDNKILDL